MNDPPATGASASPLRPFGRHRPISILIADDHEVLRRGPRQLLEENGCFTACGEATTGRAAVELAKELKPGVTILDLTMPDLNGREAARQIKRAHSAAEILIFTMYESEELIRQVLAAGARGYILKSDATRLIVSGVEALAAHKPFFTSSVAEAILNVYLKSGSPAADEGIPVSVLSPANAKSRSFSPRVKATRSSRRCPTSASRPSRRIAARLCERSASTRSPAWCATRCATN